MKNPDRISSGQEVPLPPSPAAELILEEPVPKKPAPDKGRVEERVEKDRVREPRPSNSYRPATGAPYWNNTPSKWFAPPREGTKRVGMSLNGPRSNGHGPVDVKAMALQEEFKLVQRVIFSNDASSNRAIMFSTVEHGERSVRICVRAAGTLAA